MLRQLDIQINQDWDVIRKAFGNVLAKFKTGSFKDRGIWVEEWGIYRYDLGPLGSIFTVNETMAKNGWTVWSGKLLTTFLPWYKQAEEYFSGLNIASVSWHDLCGDAVRHVDSKVMINGVEMPVANINYIVSSEDKDAYTEMEDTVDPALKLRYNSIPGNIVLMDPTQYHTVHNTGHREALQIKFYNTYQEVSDFLDKKKPVIFS